MVDEQGDEDDDEDGLAGKENWVALKDVYDALPQVYLLNLGSFRRCVKEDIETYCFNLRRLIYLQNFRTSYFGHF